MIASVLTVITIPLEHSGNLSIDLFDRPVAIAGIWTVVFLGVLRRKSERKTHEYAHDLERSNAELQQFDYVSSYDLQEPLRMVTAYLGLLEKNYGDKLDHDAKKYMDFAVEGGLRTKDLISNLLRVLRVNIKKKISRGRTWRACSMRS